MDSFFSKGFKGSKCKTLLKLTIPRIKLLRNRKEIQLKQMRRDIAKLLQTGQEATARIRVEHIIREEKMMAAHEIIELFCELIAVRLPIIEAQKECPIDLKEAISSVCFAAPRCADLPELMQVQMLFAGKYGKEFVSRSTELLPDCGVNRQLIELLSVRAPAPDVKLQLLKDIAEEHELDWDPSASENELLKPHEDLLNGPTHFVSGYKVPLPEEKHEEALHAVSEQTSGEKSDSDVDLDSWEFPEVPKQQPLKVSTGDVSAPEMLPFPASALSDDQLAKSTAMDEGPSEQSRRKPEEVLQEKLVTKELESTKTSAEEKQFVPFISPPAPSSPTGSVKQNISSPSISATESETKQNQNIPTPSLSAAKSETKQNQNIPPSVSAAKSGANVDLQDLLAAAQAAADTAERAAAAARSAANLAQLKINEFAKSNNLVSDSTVENPFHADTEKSNLSDDHHLGHQSSLHNVENYCGPQISHVPSFDDTKVEYDSVNPSSYVPGQGSGSHQFERLPSVEDEFSYPNLFSSQGSRAASRANSFADDSRSMHE